MTALAKYLHQYAEPEIQQLASFPVDKHFHHGLVIPVYHESAKMIDRFSLFAETVADILVVIVLNRPDTDSNTDWAREFLSHPAFNPTALIWQSQDKSSTLYALNNNSSILLVDRCVHRPAIPVDHGVGLARKIGADILCQLINQGRITSPWIANTDADAYLPLDYFSAQLSDNITVDNTTAALVYAFEHVYTDNDPNQLATLLYEFSLYYYVRGLSWAASPYAFHTIGSTIAIHYQHYAKVRGFPKRSAAEDFYLLNKIAKTGNVVSLTQPIIQLKARASIRVPFGTGPAVRKLTEDKDPLSMPLYHPDSFFYLKFFLQLLDQLADNEIAIDTAIKSLQKVWGASIDTDLLLQLTDGLKLQPALLHSYKQGNNKSTRLRHLQHWFDGFKTLKFIHQLRDQRLGTISFRHWLENADNPTFQINRVDHINPSPLASPTMRALSLRIKTLDQNGVCSLLPIQPN